MNASTRPDDNITAAFTGTVTLNNEHYSGVGSDVLKFSKANANILGECSAAGGKENACDANNESDVAIQGRLALLGGDQAGLVVKGRSKFRTFNGFVTFTPSALSKTDVLADDWSDQSQKASDIEMAATRTDNQPVRVVFGRWRRPKIHGPSKVVWGWTIGLHAYNIAKGLVRTVLRIPVGVKGPSWM